MDKILIGHPAHAEWYGHNGQQKQNPHPFIIKPTMQRLAKEFKDIELDSKEQNYQVKQVESLLHWQLTLPGPKDTPYEGGVFKIDVKFPSEYPFKFPDVRFSTPIYHPGVLKEQGKICADVIGEKEWKPNCKFITIIHKLMSLLASPDHVQNPINNEAQQDVVNGTFNKKAKEMTEKYAMGKE